MSSTAAYGYWGQEWGMPTKFHWHKLDMGISVISSTVIKDISQDLCTDNVYWK
jgi:hypothetical protein